MVSAATQRIGSYGDFANPDLRSPEDPNLLVRWLDSDDEVIDRGNFGLLSFNESKVEQQR
jgi:hypothetical protein